MIPAKEFDGELWIRAADIHLLPKEHVTWGVDWGKAGDIPCVCIIKRLPNGNSELVAVEYAPYSYAKRENT